MLWVALLLTGGFAIVEAIGGHFAGSLALISDAGHMATDAAAFVVALVAQVVARRPPSARASYGYGRAEVLAAFVNAIGMLVLVLWIAIEAARRFLDPAPVAGSLMMAVAAGGLAVNLVVAWMLGKATGGLNARGALLHVVGDILGSVAALVAGAVILVTGWTPIDPLLSLVVAVLILRSTWALLKEAGACCWSACRRTSPTPTSGTRWPRFPALPAFTTSTSGTWVRRASRCPPTSRWRGARTGRRCSGGRSGCWRPTSRSTT